MATVQENTAAKKARETGATASTELVLGAGALKLSQATTNLNAAITAATAAGQTVLADLNQQASTLTLQIANGEERVEQLKAEATEAKRRNKVEIDLDFQADAAAAARKYADSNGKTIIDTKVYEAEQQAADELQDKFEERVQKEVSTATAASAIKHSYELKAAQADYATKEAGNLARINSLEEQLTAARGTIVELRADIDKNREAEVKRAQAASVGSINVNPAGR